MGQPVVLLKAISLKTVLHNQASYHNKRQKGYGHSYYFHLKGDRSCEAGPQVQRFTIVTRKEAEKQEEGGEEVRADGVGEATNNCYV